MSYIIKKHHHINGERTYSVVRIGDISEEKTVIEDDINTYRDAQKIMKLEKDKFRLKAIKKKQKSRR